MLDTVWNEFQPWWAKRNDALQKIDNARAAADFQLMAAMPMWKWSEDGGEYMEAVKSQIDRNMQRENAVHTAQLQKLDPFTSRDADLSFALLVYIREYDGTN